MQTEEFIPFWRVLGIIVVGLQKIKQLETKAIADFREKKKLCEKCQHTVLGGSGMSNIYVT